MEKNNTKEFFTSSAGKLVITMVSMVIIYGLLMAAVATDNSYIALIIAVICAYFGWKALNKITPNIFLIMPIGKWAMYYLIKGCLSIFVGVFVAPFQIARIVTNKVQDKLNS